jgi:RHS repeat-associated protein
MKPLTIQRAVKMGWRARWRTTAVCLFPVYMATSMVPYQLLFADATPTRQQAEPKIVLTTKKVHVNKHAPSGAMYDGVKFSDHPTDNAITLSHAFAEPLIPLGGSTLHGEDLSLAVAIKKYINRKQADDVSALTEFLTDYPNSPWRVSLDLNLAEAYYRTGAFSMALDSWQDAWTRSQKLTDAKGVLVGNFAAAKLAKMEARIGRPSDLESLMTQIRGRSFSGSAAQLISQANSGLWLMKNRPQNAFRCGPSALQEILIATKGRLEKPNLINESKSTPKGIALSDVAKLAAKLGMSMQVAKRSPGAAFLVPAVVHWKLGHYAAIVGVRDGKYEVHDTTFGGAEFLISGSTLDRESSGYFLVPAGPLPSGWVSVPASESAQVFGRGNTQNSDSTAWGDDASCSNSALSAAGGGDCGSAGGGYSDLNGGEELSLGEGMTVPSVKAMEVSMTLADTPISYVPPVGPKMPFTVLYNQRDDTQPATFTYGNFGPGWTYGFLSYLTPGASTSTVYERGGGVETFHYNSTTSQWTPSQMTQEVLTEVNSNTWTRTFPTGDVETYSMPDGSGRLFLTQITDPQGNSMALTYDANFRLTAITDALGQVTTVSYESNTVGSLPSFYQISQVTDPFGRSANFTYNTAGQLQSTTDVLGITSSYSYTSSGFVGSLATPYGTTSCSYGDNTTNPSLGTTRWLNITYPDGYTTRTEYNEAAPGIGETDAAGIPSGMYPGITSDNAYMMDRDTYYWDKQAYQKYAGNYLKARVIHWLHSTDSNTTSQIEESHRYTDQNRLWFAYAGQTDSIQASPGMLALPIRKGRILDDGTTQIFSYTYNPIGKPTAVIDPLGRETDYAYASNNIDLLTVKRKNGTGSDLLSTYTYNGQHEVLTATDASGQETVYTYESNGELASITDAKGNSTTYDYNAAGYLTGVVGPISGDTSSFTYDGFGRVRTTTDSQGYVCTLDYDEADRPTQVTYPDGTTTQTVYQNLNAIYTKDRQGHWLRTFYNPVGLPISVVDSAGNGATTNWTPVGNVQSYIDSVGHATSWAYDDQNRAISKTYADGSSSSVTYENTTSRVKSTTDVGGQVTTPTYNLDNTVAQVAYTNAEVATPTISYTYDPVYPRVLTMVDGIGTTTYSYNPVLSTPALGAGAIASVATSLATVSYTYDQLGREVGEKINDSATGQGLSDNSVSVSYDALGRVTGVTNALSGSGSFGYGYLNTTGRVATFTNPSGPSTVFSYQDSTTTGEPRLSEIKNLNASSAVVSKFDYAYDADGKITTWTQQADSSDPQQWAMQYDRSKRLAGVAVTDTVTGAALQNYGYTYDAAGNRTNAQVGAALYPAQVNALNQAVAVTGPVNEVFAGSLSKPGTVTVAGTAATMDGTYTNFMATVAVPSGAITNNVPVVATSANGYASTNNYQVVVPPTTASPTYDANGNLTADSTRSYSWDAKGALVKITYADSSYSTFSYNGAGQRVAIREYSTTGSLTSTKQFVGGSMLTEERDGSNLVTKRLFAQGEQQVSGGTATNFFYTRDHLGSIRELTDGTGAVQARYGYDPYGQRTKLSGSADTELGFTGYFYHSISDLNLSPTRAYNAKVGRWISRDVSGESSGLNLYAYCGDDPVNNVDPDGQFAIPLRSLFSLFVRAAPVEADAGAAILGVALAPELFAAAAAIGTALLIASVAELGVDAYEGYEASLPAASTVMPVVPDQGQAIAAGGGMMPQGPCPEDSSALSLGSDAAEEVQGGVYLLRDAEGTVVRTGRTGDLAAREGQHALDPALKDFDFEAVYRTDNYAEQRGLEQMLHDAYVPKLNYINPISPTNANRQLYLDAAQQFLDKR